MNLKTKEGTMVQLEFPGPASVGTYEEIKWFKGTTKERVPFVLPRVSGGKPLYYGHFCSGPSPYENSTHGELNVTSGQLIIYNVNRTDEDKYFYVVF